MKKPTVLFAGTLATLALIGPVFAQSTTPSATTPGMSSGSTTSATKDTTTTPAEKPSKLALPHRLTGELVTIDQNAKTFTVKSAKGKEMVFTAEGEALARLADLKPGERIKVTYKNSHGHMIATKVAPSQVAASK
jgi:hypothetical protein